MKVVIDTNIFVMVLTSRSHFHKVYQELIAGKYTLVLNQEILLEYQEIIPLKYGEKAASIFLQLIEKLPNVLFIQTYYRWQLIERDPDDNKFVDCAIAGQADFLVSQDRHFDILKTIDFPKVEVIKLEDFIQFLMA